ncbi:MAG: YgjV family protein [Treponema sp.]|nr:YgjV family protein [Treponema sp.]
MKEFFNFHNLIELVGYLGSIIVIISMLTTSVVKLRIINTIGSFIFACYAICIHSYPTAIMQACLILINIISLYKLLNIKKDYSIVALNWDDSFLNFFLQKYKSDILKFFPNEELLLEAYKQNKTDYILFISCGTIPVGIFMGKKSSSQIQIFIDYTIPAYRDCSAGKFLYNYLAEQGIVSLSSNAETKIHELYLMRMGFVKKEDKFIKVLQ